MNVYNLHDVPLDKFISLNVSSILGKMGIIVPAQDYMSGKHPAQCLILRNSFSSGLKTNMKHVAGTSTPSLRELLLLLSVYTLPASELLSNISSNTTCTWDHLCWRGTLLFVENIRTWPHQNIGEQNVKCLFLKIAVMGTTDNQLIYFNHDLHLN